MLKSLKSKLMSILAVGIIIPMAVSGTISYILAGNALQNEIEAQLKMTASNLNEKMSERMGGMCSTLEAVVNEDFSKAVSGSDPSAAARVQNFLKSMLEKQKGRIEGASLANSKGIVVMAGDGEGTGIDVSDRSYFKEAMQGKAAASEVLLSKTSKKPVVAVSVPIYDGSTVVGVLFAVQYFDMLTEEVRSTKINEEGYAYVVDRDGLIIAHKDEAVAFNKNIVEIAKENNSKEFVELATNMKEGHEGNGLYTTEAGVKKYVAFTPGDKWTVVVVANYKEYMSPAFEIRGSTILVGLLSVIIALAAASIFVVFSILRPIKMLRTAMEHAGEGDLTVHADIGTRDEIQKLARSFNSMVKSQRHIVDEVRRGAQSLSQASEETTASAEEISASAEEISASFHELSEGAGSQKESITAASQSLVQLSQLVEQAQNRALQSKSNSEKALKAAEEGRNWIGATVDNMETISERTQMSFDRMKHLKTLSDQVFGITQTIKGIAEQTNLLALNAAIEAARAGENGLGFNVVAEEVRKLSEQANMNSREISSLLKDMAQQTDTVLEAMQENLSVVQKGSYTVKETDTSFINIQEAIGQIGDDIVSIADIACEELTSSEKLVRLIKQIAEVTEQTAAAGEHVLASVEEQTAGTEALSACAGETSAMAEKLVAMVEVFKT